MSDSGRGLKVAILAAGPSTAVMGGAERFYQGLLSGFQSLGCHAELVQVVADEPDFEAIIENYRKVEKLDLSRFDVVVSTKAPTFAVRHPCHVLYLVHTVRAFDDMFGAVFPEPREEHFRQRAAIHALDFHAMAEAKARFAIGHEVADRLYRWRGLDAKVIHPPLGFNAFRSAPSEGYFFVPGRLHEWKRIDLVIDAVRRSTRSLRLVIAGAGEAETSLRARAAGDERITFVGRIDDDTLVDYYARALAVPFVPMREDFGYVALEAFASAKPVITCVDSGEPARLVIHHENGLVCQPTADGLCEAMEWLIDNQDAAREMGIRGARVVAGTSWEQVGHQLIEAALSRASPHAVKEACEVSVFDMQPIDPPIGGGRLRLLGLYHALGPDVRCSYVGSYDWPGEPYRRHQLSDSLEEIDVPLSDEHHRAASELSRQAGGKTVIDISFGELGELSSDYVAAARLRLRDSDIVVFSHPWTYPLLEDAIRPDQVVVYDAQNFEGFLRAQLLDESSPVQARLLCKVVENELALCQRADLVFVCSQEDLERFNRLYRIAADKMRVIPNGVMAFRDRPASAMERDAAKQRLGLQRWGLVAFFIGSAYGPNVEAATFIANELAPKAPDVLFVIGGGVGAACPFERENLLVTGALSEEERLLWLRAADIAINPMFSGSGTNIKMFDFMAFGLPTITTETGARGIATNGHEAFLLSSDTAAAFVEGIDRLRCPQARARIGEAARLCVEQGFAWERISPLAGQLLRSRGRYARQPLPLFSVLVVISGNGCSPDPFLYGLGRQIERDFEVVVVDRSLTPSSVEGDRFGFPVTYSHAPHLDLGGARNAGALLANGSCLVLVHERDLPDEGWLFRLREELTRSADDAPIVAWVQPALDGAGAAVPRLAVRMDALRLVGGFEADGAFHDLSDPEALLERLRRVGIVKHTSCLDVAGVRGDETQGPIVLLSTQGHKCGVGEYSASLVRAFEEKGFETHVLSCRGEMAGLPSSTFGRPMHIGWYYDDRRHVASRIYDQSEAFVRAVEASLVVIEYHPAFFSMAELTRFATACADAGATVVIDNHRFSAVDVSALRELVDRGATIFLHRQGECRLARDLGLQVVHSPLGVEDRLPADSRSIARRDWKQAPPKLVTTGFLRGHKGVRILLGAMPKILAAFPGALLRVQCAEYPSPDSAEELIRCRAMIEELGLDEHIVLDTEFHQKSEMLALIRDADLALLAYEESEEGGSAAAGDCLSVGLPLVVSTASIFEDVSTYAYICEGGAEAWADAVTRLLSSPEAYARLSSSARSYVEENGWSRIADHFVQPLAD